MQSACNNAGVTGGCAEQQGLIADVQQHLIRIIELSKALSDALANGDEDLARTIDQETEKELGAKERALGALRQHRKDHGC